MKTKEEFFARPLPTEVVDLPDGGAIRVRAMTAGERTCFTDLITDGVTHKLKISCHVVAMCSIDDDGARIFDDGDADTISEKTSSRDVDAISNAVIRLSGMEKKPEKNGVETETDAPND